MVLWLFHGQKFKKILKGAPRFLVQESHREGTSQNDPAETVYEGKETKSLKLDFV